MIALILGGLFLFPFPSIEAPELPGGQIQVSRWLLAAIGAVVLLFVIWLIRELRVAARPGSYVPTGTSNLLIGTSVTVTKALEPVGEVYAAGEAWTARTSDRSEVETGHSVKVIEIEGITRIVEPQQQDEVP